MELVRFAKDVVQNLAEQAASYRIGQSALRHLDRALWVVEKCARWAVPPPLDQDERPPPELVRPLPWVFFLPMLVILRLTRESISLVNLVRGKPPLRSADVVMYIQSKRRYLRTLKYQGNRTIRARGASSQPWYSSLQALLDFTMCFRRSHYGNNNTTRVSNNDEVLVVKRSKHTRDSTEMASSETTMERLIEKMMVQLDADSDDDSSYTLTNATSMRSLRSEESEADQDTTLENYIHNEDITNSSLVTVNYETSVTTLSDSSPVKEGVTSSTPEKTEINNERTEDADKKELENKENPKIEDETDKGSDSKIALSEPNNIEDGTPVKENSKTGSPNDKSTTKLSPKETTNNFLQSERCSPQKQPSKQAKFANGRAISVPNKKKGLMTQRRDTDIAVTRHQHE